jgi:L-fuculose-phosphate aldolase
MVNSFRYDCSMEISRKLRAAIDAAGDEVIAAGRFLGRRQYHVALAGNISSRVTDQLLVCTRHGADKEKLTRADLVLCDMDGARIEGEGRPTSELNMHRAAYRHRPEIQSVIHSHPPTATAFAAASLRLDELQLPEMLVLLGPVGMVSYATPGSEELAKSLAQLLPGRDAFLLENHGALTLGLSVRQAALRMDLLEQNARITLMTRQLGPAFSLDPASRETLMGFREKMARWGSD